jgi:hypothetical protein
MRGEFLKPFAHNDLFRTAGDGKSLSAYFENVLMINIYFHDIALQEFGRQTVFSKLKTSLKSSKINMMVLGSFFVEIIFGTYS